jgi:predicted O-methyltransferase YrrM
MRFRDIFGIGTAPTSLEQKPESADCLEADTRRVQQDAAAPLFAEPGHFYSPIVHPTQLRASSFDRRRAADKLLGIDLDFAAMEDLSDRLAKHQEGLDFPSLPIATHRYHRENGMYDIGDATILACMLRHFGPKQIIEVGSGFSSAVIFDTIDRTPDLSPACTFIEPYTDRLEALLRPSDFEHARIIRTGVQDVPAETFEALGSGDILFLDTTHVSKTGSDVNYEIFEILPRLSSGVIIHLHDIFADFEYPAEWIYELNRSWNEQYILRAFLMYNNAFSVIYANAAFAKARPELIREKFPQIFGDAGAGFWLRKK